MAITEAIFLFTFLSILCDCSFAFFIFLQLLSIQLLSIFTFPLCILALSRVEPLLSLAAEFAIFILPRYIHSLFVHASPHPILI